MEPDQDPSVRNGGIHAPQSTVGIVGQYEVRIVSMYLKNIEIIYLGKVICRLVKCLQISIITTHV